MNSFYTVGPFASYTTFTALASAKTLSSGDIVEFQATASGSNGTATFNEKVQPNGIGGGPNSPIWIRGRTGDTIVIDAQFVRANTLLSTIPYVIFDNLTCNNNNGSGFSSSVGFNGANNNTIQNCTINVTLTGDGIADRRGIASVNGCHYLSILNNAINIGPGDWEPGETDAMLVGGSGLIIRGNTIKMYNSGFQIGGGHNDCIQTLNSSNFVIEQNYVDRYVKNTATQGQAIYTEWYNLNDADVTNYGSGIIRNNLIFGNGGSYLLSTNPRANAGQTKAAIVSLFIQNNTVDAYNFSGSLPCRITYTDTWVGGSLTMQNNIFIARRPSTSGSQIVCTVEPPYSGINLVVNNNHYFPTGAAQGASVFGLRGIFLTWSGWQASGLDTNGIGYDGDGWKDPLFVDWPNQNYRLSSGSPDIVSGVNLSSYFTADLAGATRIIPWDIGAYAYFASLSRLTRMGRFPRLTVYHAF
jgi:hypothetical protein